MATKTSTKPSDDFTASLFKNAGQLPQTGVVAPAGNMTADMQGAPSLDKDKLIHQILNPRLTIGGQMEDPNAPTGIDWLNAHNHTGGHSWEQPNALAGHQPQMPQPQPFSPFAAPTEMAPQQPPMAPNPNPGHAPANVPDPLHDILAQRMQEMGFPQNGGAPQAGGAYDMAAQKAKHDALTRHHGDAPMYTPFNEAVHQGVAPAPDTGVLPWAMNTGGRTVANAVDWGTNKLFGTDPHMRDAVPTGSGKNVSVSTKPFDKMAKFLQTYMSTR